MTARYAVLIVLLILILAGLMGFLCASALADGPEVQVTADSLSSIPPNAMPLMCNGSWETGDWSCWQDRSTDPATSIIAQSPYHGQWLMRQGGRNDTLTGTYQIIELYGCDPAYPIWLVRALRMTTEEPILSAYTAQHASLWSIDWNTEVAWLWEFYEQDMVNGQWRVDTYRIENAVQWGMIRIWIATWNTARPYTTYWDHDAYQMWCVPPTVNFTVYLPLVVSQ